MMRRSRTRNNGNKNCEALRILDVNFNRAQEGLRVCEDVVRFHIESIRSYRKLRAVRHKLASLRGAFSVTASELINTRRSHSDIGRKALSSPESSLERLLIINFQRVKESLRVLEEVSRIIAHRRCAAFQELRFRTYDIEREILCQLATLLHR